MIAFGSQRSGGGDLATHLSNAHDNEYVEVHDLRGSIADDLHGAFAEWEAQAHAMTKAKRYLYSLSINPDERDGRLTREQYEDYINRAEESLGLGGQPRAIVFHIKEGIDEALREHCHVVWSRIDAQDCKAINIPFDRYKLMQVSRDFALDHNRTLADGYDTGRAKDKQLSLYEKLQQDVTGITREERREVITGLWQRSDSASAFVAALSDNGYILSQGRRPYCLVDYYGDVHSLPRLIDDKQVRLADVKAFLAQEFPNEELPLVDEARELAEKQREADKEMVRKEEHAEAREVLLRSQEDRAAKLKEEIALTAEQHALARAAQSAEFATKRAALEEQQAGQNLKIERKREQSQATGMIALMERMSGAAFVRKLWREREDRLRSEAQHQQRVMQEQTLRTERETRILAQGLEMRELKRREQSQKLTFEREQQSLAKAQQQELAIHYRRGIDHMPKAALTLTPSGRMAQPARAQHRHSMRTAKELNVKADVKRDPEEPLDLPHEFAVAAHSPDQSRNPGDASISPKPPPRRPGKGRKR